MLLYFMISTEHFLNVLVLVQLFAQYDLFPADLCLISSVVTGVYHPVLKCLK